MRRSTKSSGFRSAGEPVFRDLFLEILGVETSAFFRSSTTAISTPHDRRAEGFRRNSTMRSASSPAESCRLSCAPTWPRACRARPSRPCSRWPGKARILCLGGGLAMNAMLVAALESSGQFKNVWVQPAAGNAGTAVGGAFHAWHQVLRRPERHRLETCFSGPSTTAKTSSRCSKTASCASSS